MLYIQFIPELCQTTICARVAVGSNMKAATQIANPLTYARHREHF
jgi:hypothetical protein